MSNAFLEAAAQGKNTWWRYVATVVVFLIATLIIGALPIAVVAVVFQVDNNPLTSVNPETAAITGLSPALGLALQLLPFVCGLVALLGGVALFHRRHPRTLVTPGRPINWGRIAAAAGLWAALAGAAAVVEALLYPGRYAFTPNLGDFIPYALVAIILLPLQTSAEELFFRSYLLQGVGRLIRQPVVLSLLSGLAFAVPHLANPEVSVDFWPVMAGYFVTGVGLAALTLRTESAEVALGLHAGNNLFAALFATFPGSALASPALFTANTLDPWYSLISGAVALVVFWVIASRWREAAPAVGAGGSEGT
jgi:membrane protease YdiL (CAAX protease family)